MTYNLAEFKDWLAEDESRKGDMPQVAQYWESLFIHYLTDDKPNYGWDAITNPSYDPYKEIFWSWIAEREQGGDPNMLNFCLWCHQEKRLVPGKFTCSTCDNKLPLQVQTEQQAKEAQREQEIDQWKQKLTTYRNQRKIQLTQEITLIKEVLNE